MKKELKAKWDGRRRIRVTSAYKTALHQLLESQMEMMRENGFYAETWQWGVCEIEDLGSSRGLTMYFGDEDHPKWFKGETGVRVK